MKKSKTKRILALVLSLLMIVTSVPIAAFTAFAADDVTEVKNAMAAYETKMNGTVYTNMGAAYDAYVNCQKALDAYNYGGVSNALSGKAAALNSATEAMQPWSIAFDAQAYHTTNIATDGYSNVIYTTGNASTDETSFSGEASDAGITVKYAAPKAIVIAYDGENEASVPAVLETKLPGKTFCSKQVIHYAESNNNTMYFDGVWNGYMDGNWQSWPKDNISAAAVLSGQSSDTSHTHTPNNKSTSRFWWNKLAYHGTGNTTDYYETFSNVGLNVYCYFDNWGDKYSTLQPAVTNNIYVINYAAVKNLIKSYSSALASVVANGGVSNYKEGGLSDVIHAIANLTVINPNNYSYADVAAGVQNCANDIKAAVAANSNKTIGAADSAGYQSVRNAMTDMVINTYNNGTNGWTEETWNAFKAAFETAQSMMGAPYTNNTGYTATNGEAVAAELTRAFEGLRSNKTYADTSALTAVIERFKTYEGIFTDASYQNALNVIENAIVTIWGDADKYGIVTAGPEDNEAGVALVAEQTKAVEDAVAALRIDPETSVMTTAGRFTLNQVIEYKVENTELYYNYVDFASAVDAAKQYRNAIAIAELTDYEAQYEAYKAEVQKVLDAFFGLEYALTAIPDGTVYANDSVKTMTTMSANWQGITSLTPTYTNKAVVIKTTHDTTTVPFGKFSLDLMTQVTNGSTDNNKGNNIGIDSITLHATAAPVTDNFLSKNTGVMSDRMCPANMSDIEKTTYAGLLSYNGFSVSNLKYTGKTSNSNPHQYITDAAGNRITDENEALNYNLDTVLGVTDGNCSSVNDGHVYGVVFNHSTGGDAHVYVEGDFCADIRPSSVAANMTVRTTPRLSSANLSGTRFGAVVNHACRDTTFCAARCWFTSDSNNESIVADVEVVDIAYLLDLIKICDEIADNSSKYTTESFNNFAEALKAAKVNYEYTDHTASEFVGEAVTRYQNLWNAKEALELADYNVTFSYKNADGEDVVSTFSVEWGQTLESIRTQIEAIATPDFVADGMTNTFKAWSPALDYSTVIYSDMPYTAVYDQFSSVDWEIYNAAQDKLLNDLQNGPYYADGLEAIKALADSLSYFTLTAEEKGRVTANNQELIDAEAAKLAEIDAELAKYAADSSTYDALVKTVDTLNADAYDVASVQAVMAETSASRTVTIGGVDYTGWDYDFFIETVISKMNETAYKYTVVVYDIDYNAYFVMQDGSSLIPAENYDEDGMPIAPEGAGYFHYGDVVTVTNPINPGEACSYDVTIIAQNTDTLTSNKYVCTAAEYTFNVRGNTEVSTDAGETSDIKLSFIDGRTNTLVYTNYQTPDKNGNVSIRRFQEIVANIPSVPFYNIQSLTNRATGATVPMSGSVTFTEDMVININYGPQEQVGDYTITLLDVNGNKIFNQSAKWNQRITLTANGAAGMVDTKSGKLVAYGSEYTFYACQSITLQAVDTVDGKVAVSVAEPVVSNGKVYFTGSFAKQNHVPNSDVTVKGYGIVIDTLGMNKELTLKDVSRENRIFNLAASSETCGSQFTLFTNKPSNRAMMTYRAYVIYEENGVECIEYSDVVDTTIL